MRQLLELLRSKIFLLACVIFLSLTTKKSYCIDSVYIKFIHKKINIQDYGYCAQFSIKDKLYLFIKDQCDTTIKCFVFRQNENIAFGRLNIKNIDSNKIAAREGYWRFKRGKVFIKKYYHDDVFIEPDDFPTEKQPVYYPYKKSS